MTGVELNSKKQISGIEYNALLYCKTNIGGLFFDAFTELTHTRETEITENPVASGASMVDHAYVKPAELEVQIAMSDVHASLVDNQFEGAGSRSVKAWDLLKQLQAQRIPLSVLTRLEQYDNMLISKIEATDDADTIHALKATVSLKEIPVARVKTVKISAAPTITDSAYTGMVDGVTTSDTEKQSILYMLFKGGF